jgi:hypothetical protein
MALTKAGPILFFGIERVIFDREIFPFSVFRYRPSEFQETRAGLGLRPHRKKIPQAQFLDLHGKRRLPGLKGMDLAPVEEDMADDPRMGFCY